MVQLGPQPGLRLEEREGKGRGLVTTYSLEVREGKGRGLVTYLGLQEGQFVCEYAGEVIGEEVARRRTSRQTRFYRCSCFICFLHLHFPVLT